ncbi:hypothetical protein BDZ94DRAFT_1256866, partial [Collybia nuda]
RSLPEKPQPSPDRSCVHHDSACNARTVRMRIGTTENVDWDCEMRGSTVGMWLQTYSVKPLIKFKHLVSECQFQGSSSLLSFISTALAHSRSIEPMFKSNYTVQNDVQPAISLPR